VDPPPFVEELRDAPVEALVRIPTGFGHEALDLATDERRGDVLALCSNLVPLQEEAATRVGVHSSRSIEHVIHVGEALGEHQGDLDPAVRGMIEHAPCDRRRLHDRDLVAAAVPILECGRGDRRRTLPVYDQDDRLLGSLIGGFHGGTVRRFVPTFASFAHLADHAAVIPNSDESTEPNERADD